jgi:hypothetical protein
MRQGSPGRKDQIQFIVFSDIVYGAVIGALFSFLVGMLQNGKGVPVALLIWVYLVVCDDWYGAHYLALQYPANERVFLIEITGMLLYVILGYLASRGSLYMLLGVAAYGLAGFVWDREYLAICTPVSEERIVLRIWAKGAIALCSIYLSFFATLVGVHASGHSAVTAALSVGIWVGWRMLLAQVVQRRVRKVM